MLGRLIKYVLKFVAPDIINCELKKLLSFVAYPSCGCNRSMKFVTKQKKNNPQLQIKSRRGHSTIVNDVNLRSYGERGIKYILCNLSKVTISDTGRTCELFIKLYDTTNRIMYIFIIVITS